MKWEYYSLKTSPEELENKEKFLGELNNIGWSGWELICAIPVQSPNGETKFVEFLFKKRLR